MHIGVYCYMGAVTCYTWFTFSSRQHETRREWECEGYILLIFHTLDLFSSRLKTLGDMLVNLSQVKGNMNVSTLSCSFCTRVWMSTFVRPLSHSHLTKSLDEYARQECKPSIRPMTSFIAGCISNEPTSSITLYSDCWTICCMRHHFQKESHSLSKRG